MTTSGQNDKLQAGQAVILTTSWHYLEVDCIRTANNFELGWPVACSYLANHTSLLGYNFE